MAERYCPACGVPISEADHATGSCPSCNEPLPDRMIHLPSHPPPRSRPTRRRPPEPARRPPRSIRRTGRSPLDDVHAWGTYRAALLMMIIGSGLFTFGYLLRQGTELIRFLLFNGSTSGLPYWPTLAGFRAMNIGYLFLLVGIVLSCVCPVSKGRPWAWAALVSVIVFLLLHELRSHMGLENLRLSGSGTLGEDTEPWSEKTITLFFRLAALFFHLALALFTLSLLRTLSTLKASLAAESLMIAWTTLYFIAAMVATFVDLDLTRGVLGRIVLGSSSAGSTKPNFVVLGCVSLLGLTYFVLLIAARMSLSRRIRQHWAESTRSPTDQEA